MERKTKLHPALAALIVIVLVGIVASVVIVVNNNNKVDDTTAVEPHDASTHSHGTTDEATIDSTDVSEYEDGTYTATGSYISPGGRESIDLTVTIKGGIIESTSVVTKATDAEAQEHQELFKDHYQALVVGKEINGLSLSRVAGSSLTSNGFNNALDEIRDEARA